MTDMAIAKLDKELKQLQESKKRDMKISVMMEAVHDALVEFCRQTEEFAQAVVQGGSFEQCMVAVAKGVGNSISDLDAYRRAVQFYFPGAGIRVKWTGSRCGLWNLQIGDTGNFQKMQKIIF